MKTATGNLTSMPLIFGFDIGTTSVGFAVIEHDPELASGKIHRLGARIFPERVDYG